MDVNLIDKIITWACGGGKRTGRRLTPRVNILWA